MDPTRDPTRDPTIDPTLDPTDGPTYDPTIDPSADPTVDPTKDPSLDPTIDPTLEPTIQPTADPTVDPTDNPTSDPTSDATTQSPTVSPTHCFNAKYQSTMLSATSDQLLFEESLVSNNCFCQLQLQTDGNLILFGKVSQTDDEMVNGWSTNTKIANYSEQSEARFVFGESGNLQLTEILFPGIDYFENNADVLWKTNVSEDASANYSLTLSNLCCLSLSKRSQLGFDTTIWRECAELVSSTTLPPTMTVTNETFSSSELESNESSSGLLRQLWWVWVIVAAIFLCPFFWFFVYRKMHETNDTVWISPSTMPTNCGISDDDYDENECSEESEGDQLAKWAKETAYIPKQGSSKLQSVLYGENSVIIMSDGPKKSSRQHQKMPNDIESHMKNSQIMYSTETPKY